MRIRIKKLKSFDYQGQSIRAYCRKHLRDDECLYRIFYYDTEPLRVKGHNPVTQQHIDFAATDVAKEQTQLLESLRRTPNFALRLGKTVWQNKEWILRWDVAKKIISGDMDAADLDETHVKPKIVQKTVDMKMGLDISSIALKRVADKLIVISGDSDIVPALKLARTEGMEVGLDPLWNNISSELSEHVDYIRTCVPKPAWM